jgi:hypothetical protein
LFMIHNPLFSYSSPWYRTIPILSQPDQPVIERFAAPLNILSEKHPSGKDASVGVSPVISCSALDDKRSPS